MIGFRQKMFILPLAALANTAMIGSAGIGFFQGKKQQEELERQGQEQQKAAEQQAELLRDQNRKLEKISEKVKSDPSSVGQLGEAMSQKDNKVIGRYYTMIKQKNYSIMKPILGVMGKSKFMQNAKGFGKDILKYVNSTGDSVNKAGKLIEGAGKAPRRQVILGNIMAGTALGVGTYGVNKAIQADRRSMGFEDTPVKQTQYSVMGTIGNLAKETWKHNKGGVGLSLALAAIPGVGYLAERSQMKSQQNASKITQPDQKNYSILSGITRGFKTLASHPGQTILGGTNKFVSFGVIGRREVGSFANKMANSKNAWSNKLGNAMLSKDKAGNILRDEAGNVMANKKALAGSALVGGAVVSGAWNQSEKAVGKIGRKLDPNAYAYQDNKEKLLQS